MHKLRLQLLLFFICSVKCSLLHGMLSVESAENKYVLWSTIITSLPRDAYDTHRTLALVNKEYNKIIEERYRPDKKRIEKLMLQRGTPILPGQVSWNKDFSKCAWVTIGKTCLYNRQKLKLTLVGLDRNRDIIIVNGKCGGYKSPVIDDQTCPFFDTEGGIFCYGIGDIKSSFNNGYNSSYNNAVIEYSLSFDGEIKNKRCVLNVGNCLCGLENGLVINFPVLLKAFLRSTEVYESSITTYGIAGNCYYMINHVVIPEDYKTFKKHAFFDSGHLSYDDLPKMLRDAIDKQYEEQQREKNSQISQEK